MLAGFPWKEMSSIIFILTWSVSIKLAVEVLSNNLTMSLTLKDSSKGTKFVKDNVIWDPGVIKTPKLSAKSNTVSDVIFLL